MGESYDNEIFDLAIVGAGVCGASIARCLSAYTARIVVLEKEEDISFGVSKANSGIVHGGFHHAANSLKAQLELQGGLMFDRLHRELGFPFTRCGIIVAARSEEEMQSIQALWQRGRENGVIGIEICSQERLKMLEGQLSPDIIGGLYAPGGGIVEPYRFVFALMENALQNGVRLLHSFKLIAGERAKGIWTLKGEDGRSIQARWLVNAAGLYADEVSAAVGGEVFTIKPRKGEYLLLDRLANSKPSKVVFPVPGSISKGMLVIPTVEGTVLVGPTAEEVDDKEDRATGEEHLSRIMDSGRALIEGLRERDIIANFAGLRPSLGEDFYIDVSKKAEGLIQVAGIQSPGLTAAPAIAEYVRDLLLRNGLSLTASPEYCATLPPLKQLRNMDDLEISQMVKEDPAWGNIVCRCENVSEAEIVQAIRRGHHTLDGIKFYTRAQMGRCQGAFCIYKILKIIMRETGKSWQEVSKHGPSSEILGGEL